MASAMVGGLLQRRVYAPEEIGCTCGDDPTGPALAERTGIRHFDGPETLLAEAGLLVVACKPQQLASLDPAYEKGTNQKVVLSILAGTPLARLHERFSLARNIVRAMPNTPGQIGAGITAFAARERMNGPDEEAVRAVLGSLGEVLEVPESELDAVTAVSGSGPAYLFEFTAALRAAGGHVGLSPEVADRLARRTIIGAARLLEQSGEDPEALRDAVTSKGGTTEAALKRFEDGGLRGLTARAVEAARDRSIELAGE
jgi:pyrroline-5-carboxylate reductase